MVADLKIAVSLVNNKTQITLFSAENGNKRNNFHVLLFTNIILKRFVLEQRGSFLSKTLISSTYLKFLLKSLMDFQGDFSYDWFLMIDYKYFTKSGK